jgi:hypothetical protein
MVELELDKQFLILEALNFFSSRPFSFTISVGKGFTDSFFKFLDSFDRSAEVF